MCFSMKATVISVIVYIQEHGSQCIEMSADTSGAYSGIMLGLELLIILECST